MSREQIWEPLFTQQVQALRISHRRLDDAMSQITPLLDASPPFFPRIPNTGELVIRRIKLADFPGVPYASIFYLETDESFTFLTIELLDEEQDEISY